MASRTQQLIILVTAKDMATRQLRGINQQLGVMGRGLSAKGQIAVGGGKIIGGVFNVIERGAIAAGGAIVIAAKAGMEFQDAMAGVSKTVEGTPAELKAIYEGLRALSTRIPIKFEDLAGIAQQAGALGVPTKNILAFTEVVARVTAAGTGLTESGVADAFGKMGTLFHLTGPEFSKMGSALVVLGNNAASSEADIVKMTLRFGGLAKAAGLSVPQVLAWASATASLGPLAEAGGSSLVRMFGRLIQYAGTGDKKFHSFALAAGMTDKAFKALVKSDTSAAMQKFVNGLKGMDKLKLAALLKEAGITNVRDIQAIQALANNPKVLSDALAMANKAYAENNALTQISDKRFDTLKAHWVQFKNIIRNAMVDVAEGMNPAIDRALKRLNALFQRPEMREEFKKLGQDIGDAIDRINWEKVVAAVKSLVGYARQFVDILMSLPPELLAGIAGGSFINKVSGGLIGSGISDVAGGLIRGGIGQVIGRGSPGNPMWVTWKPGLGGPGGTGPGLVPGGGKGGGLIGILSKLGAALTIVGSAAEVYNTYQDQNNMNTQVADSVRANFDKWIASSPSKADMVNGLAAIDHGIADIRSNPLNAIVQGDALNQLEAMRAILAGQLNVTGTVAVSNMPSVLGGSYQAQVRKGRPGGREQNRGGKAAYIPPGNRDMPGPGRAAGGPVMAATAYTVGEHGSETFIPDQAGVIIPNAKKKGTKANGLPVFVTNWPGNGDGTGGAGGSSSSTSSAATKLHVHRLGDIRSAAHAAALAAVTTIHHRQGSPMQPLHAVAMVTARDVVHEDKRWRRYGNGRSVSID